MSMIPGKTTKELLEEAKKVNEQIERDKKIFRKRLLSVLNATKSWSLLRMPGVDRFNHWYDNLKEPKRVLTRLGFVLPFIVMYNLSLYVHAYWFFGAGLYYLALLSLRYTSVLNLTD